MGAKLASLSGVTGATQDRGLSFITSTTFSAVSSVSVDSVFSASFDDYLVLFDALAASGSPSITMRLRVASADASGANYRFQLVYDTYAGAGADSAGATGATSFLGGLGVDSGINSLAITFAKPFNTAYTTAFGSFIHGTATGNALGRYDATTSYDGFSVISSGGNITGSIKVYGYRLA